jgi:hydroxyacylglutathione hydrolase
VTTPEVGVREAAAMIETKRPFVLDARRQTEFVEGHIEGASNISHTRLLARLKEVPRDRPILVNCRSGGRSARACSLLQKHGYDATNLAGGYLAWEKAAAPA